MQTAVIIAGGRSTRFGDADKAVAELAGTPMIRRVADRLVGVVDAFVVNCREDQGEVIKEAMVSFAVRHRLCSAQVSESVISALSPHSSRAPCNRWR